MIGFRKSFIGYRFSLNERQKTISGIVFNVFCFLIFVSFFFTNNVLADQKFNVEFRGAEIKNAVRLLAKVGGQNVVVPDAIVGKVTASFNNIDIKQAITTILKANGFGKIEEDSVMMVLPQKELENLGEDLMIESFVMQHAKAEDILSQVQSLATARGTAVADDRTNTVHVRDTSAALKSVKDLIAQLDMKGLQVLIEAKIIEAKEAFVRNIGLQWGITKTGGNVQGGGVSAVGTSDSGRNLMFNAPATGYRGSPPVSGLGLIMGSFKGTMTDVQITAAEQKGLIDLLARPSIVTMDNQPATIRSGITFYIKTNADISIGGGGGTGTAGLGSNLQEIETGIELKVTPQVSQNKYVKLYIEATQSEPDFSQEVENIPTVIDNKASTTVLLKDGETTIIGGMFKLREGKSVEGVPGLMKIPIFGNLFKSRKKEKEKKELLIFITPYLVKDQLHMLPHFTEDHSAYKGVYELEAAEVGMEAGVRRAQKDVVHKAKELKKQEKAAERARKASDRKRRSRGNKFRNN